jgi:hypothetical protein
VQLDALADAAHLVADLDQFRQARPVWDRAAEMILVAATTPGYTRSALSLSVSPGDSKRAPESKKVF